MEAIDREDIVPFSILNFDSKPVVSFMSKDDIIKHMQIVIDGCYQSISISNAFSSWKNTATGLSTIKHIDRDFYTGVRLWLTITQDQIIECNDDKLLRKMAWSYSWINDLLLVKNHIKTIDDNK